MADPGLGEAGEVRPLSELAVVQSPGSVTNDYPVGQFCFPEHSPDSFACAIIACVGPRYLVAFPSEAWARAARDRKLPAGALEKALHVQLAATIPEDRVSAIEGFNVNVWIGWLKAGLEPHFDFEPVSDCSFGFVSRELGEPCLPYGPAMVEAAIDRFQLQEVLNPIPVEARLSSMEGRFSVLEAGLNELLNLQRKSQQDVGDGGFATAAEEVEPPVGRPAPSAPRVKKLHLRPVGQRQAAPEAPPGLPGLEVHPGLDPSAVAAARQAGIPEDQLKTMSRLLSAKPAKLEDYPRASGQAKHVLDEDLDEDEMCQPEPDLDHLDPMSQALIKLTSIVENMSAAKKKQDPLDDVVNGLGSGDVGSAESGSSGMAKKHAAMRQALSRMLRDHPERLWQTIERNMEEDYLLQSVKPNVGSGGFTARGWAEHRSRIAGYPRTVRAVWGVAGILDSLRSNQPDAARARACLMLAQFEQESIDHGSFLLAQEFSMEPPPPISAFQAHSVPDPMELSATRLMNQAWVEAYADRLKQVDSYMEMRRKLNVKNKPSPGQPSQDQKPSKGKGDGKGKSKSKKKEKPEEGGEEN